MVLDSVDDFNIFFDESLRLEHSLIHDSQSISLAKYLPKSSNGTILVTSRNKDIAAKLTGGYNNIREVNMMNASEGQKLLCSKLTVAPNQESAAELLYVLDYIPLVISQAAAHINRSKHMSLSQYVTELRANKSKETLLRWESDDLRRDESASNSVVAAWQMSFDKIQQERPSAAELLSLLSFFNPQSIPGRILRNRNSAATKASNIDDIKDSSEKDLELLQAFSFVAATAGSDTYEMHPLVQSCTRLWLSSIGHLEGFESEFVQLMARVFPDANYETWPECQELLPHVDRLLEIQAADESTMIAWGQVLRDAVNFMLLQGTYKAGEEAAARMFSVSQKLLGLEHQVTLTSIAVLAAIVRARGRYKEAETLLQQAFAGRVKVHGQDHQITLGTASRLATVMHDLGKVHEAEELQRQTLTRFETTLGSDNNQTLDAANQLALLLHSLGRYEEAEKFHRYALEGMRKNLGSQHPSTLLSMNSLGGVLKAQGRYDEAGDCFREALEGRKKVFQERHPSTLTSMHNLASVLSAQEKYAEAEILDRQVLKWREEQDSEHPDTFTSVGNLARVMEAQGNLEEAEALCRRALLGRERTLGQEHIDTLLSANNLAMLLKGLKRYDEATPFFQRACNGLEKSLGHEHPWTITCRGNFSDMQLETQQMHRQSLSLYARAKARMQRRNT
jgi:tetratricopeptide (TPR) repeat protein